jgi:hypothetical protein
VRLTFDVDGDGVPRENQRLYDDARDERAAIEAMHHRAVLLGAGAALVLLGVCALAFVWLDDRWKLTATELWLLRALLLAAAVALLAAIALAVSAAWPVPRRHLGDLVQLVRNPEPPPDEERDRKLALAAVQDAQRVRSRRGRLMAWALGVFAVALTAVASQGVLFAFAVRDSSPDRAGSSTKPVDKVHALAVKYAPLIGIHDAERYGPIDPAMFLDDAELRWARGRRDVTVVRQGRLRAQAIGEDCGEGCATFGPYLPYQLTRPYRKGKRRPRLLAARQGFYLDGDAAVRPGQLVSDPPVPLFYDAQAAVGSAPLRITYWAFFPFGRAFRNQPSARGREGDWEAMTIEFDAKRAPTAVVLPRPEAPRRVSWSAIPEKVETSHPVLFATAQSHELAAVRRTDPTRICVQSVCARRLRDDDLAWRPWIVGGVRPVREEPWYGFGGAWGRAGDANRTTGPLGPSAFRQGP